MRTARKVLVSAVLAPLLAVGVAACGEDRPRTPNALIKCRNQTLTECRRPLKDAALVVTVGDAAQISAVYSEVLASAEEAGLALSKSSVTNEPPQVRVTTEPRSGAKFDAFVTRIRAIEHVVRVESRG